MRGNHRIPRGCRIALTIAGGLAAVSVAAIIVLVVFVDIRVASKESAVHSDVRPSSTASAVMAQPIVQLENHTCGYLALSALYRRYALSPNAENLRFRLGVDRLALPLADDSTGTLHPDLLRVLVEDHFRYTLLDPDSPASLDDLRTHLERGHAALLLEVRPDSGNLHWVAADEWTNGMLRIVDSLAEDVRMEAAPDGIPSRFVSIIAVSPAPDDATSPASDVAHADGVREMAAVRRRLQTRDRLPAAKGSPSHDPM